MRIRLRQQGYSHHGYRRDQGQSLIIVLLISLLTMIMVGSATTALTAQIKPSKLSQDEATSLAAAQAGLEDFIAWVNAHCPPTSGYYCASLVTGLNNKSGLTNPVTQRGVVAAGADGAGTRESFYWKVIYATSGFARVQSIGQVPVSGSTAPYRTTALVADINASPAFNNFQYFTKYETYSSDFVDSFYKPRQVEITSAASLSGTSLSAATKPGVVTWNGVCNYVDAVTTPTCDPNHDTSICDDLYYPRGTGAGRGTDSAWNNAARRPNSTTQANMGTDSSFAYYSEGGSYKPNSSSTTTAVTHNDTCDTSFEPNMIMSGPVYSQDAFLVDRGKDTGNSKNSMPELDDYAYSLWNGSLNGTTAAPGLVGGEYRWYPGTDGDVTTAKSPFPTYTTNVLDLPENANAAPRSCTYTGPTRIQIQGQFAYVTSPGTPAGSGNCYTSTGSYSNVHSADSAGQDPTDSSGGIVGAKVPISSTTIYVQNLPSTVTPTVATPSSPVFNLATNLTVPANSTTNTLTGTWTTPATYPSAVSCPLSAPDPLKQRSFDCETGKTANPKSSENVLANIKTAVNTALSTAPTTATITAAITGQLNATSLTAPTTVGGVYYVPTITQSGPTVTTTKPTAMSPTDAFYQSSTGKGYTTTTTTWTVSLDRKVCTTVKHSACSAYTSTPIVTGSAATVQNTAAGSPLNSTSSFPWFGAQTGASTYTDPNNDITQYYHGYGDAYIEGTLKGQLTVVAEHDVLATNDLLYSNTNVSTTTDGLALVANHNVRVYRPMTCTDDGTAGATSPGYCPNDLTGIVTSTLSWPLPSNIASFRYVLDNAPSLPTTGTGRIYASIFALRGSFVIDNFYRGSVGSSVNVVGGLYQYHRGPTSLPYQNRPYQGSNTKMPGMLLTYAFDNMRSGQTANGGLRVPWIPAPSGTLTGRTWNVVSVSTEP